MKKKTWIIAGTVLAAFAAACIFGGQALADKVTAEKDGQQYQSAAPEQSAGMDQTKDSLPEIELPAPSSSGTPEAKLPAIDMSAATASPTPAPTPKETITTDEDGNQTITPNWSTDKLPDGANVVSRTPEANIGGSGGGSVDLGGDGAYHGDHPGQQPTPTPGPTTEPSEKPSDGQRTPPDQPEATPAASRRLPLDPPQSPAKSPLTDSRLRPISLRPPPPPLRSRLRP